MTRGILRWGLISGLALGGVTLLVGPEHVAGGLAQLRSSAQNVVDQVVDDPIALRRQLASLAKQYPDRIAEVKGEIAKINAQINMLDNDVDKATRIVALTTDHLGELQGKIARAQSTRESGVRNVSLRFEGSRYDVDQAYNEARRINRVRLSSQDRVAHGEAQQSFLNEQRGRLVEILDTLTDEQATLDAQLWQLEQQISAVERNERLIQMTEDQKATLDSYNKFERVGNLKQLEAKLHEIMTEQEARLQSLTRTDLPGRYERQAEYDMEMDENGGSYSNDPFEGLGNDGSLLEEANFNVDDTVAWLNESIVIED
jgi:chromosome segregation ATPase